MDYDRKSILTVLEIYNKSHRGILNVPAYDLILRMVNHICGILDMQNSLNFVIYLPRVLMDEYVRALRQSVEGFFSDYSYETYNVFDVDHDDPIYINLDWPPSDAVHAKRIRDLKYRISNHNHFYTQEELFILDGFARLIYEDTIEEVFEKETCIEIKRKGALLWNS